MYSDVYGADCNSSSNKPYGLPDFGGLQPDPSLPQRCQNPSLMKVLQPGQHNDGVSFACLCNWITASTCVGKGPGLLQLLTLVLHAFADRMGYERMHWIEYH